MADQILKAAPILGGVNLDFGTCKLVERDDLALVSLAVPMGGEAALGKALKEAFGLALPSPVQSTEADGLRLIQTAPDQMMLVFPHIGADANSTVNAALKGAAYTTDQTDAWVCLELSGPGVLAALERLCPLDLEATAFPVGMNARTVVEHMGVLMIRLETNRFLLLSAGSSAGSFLHALETSIRYTAA